MSEVTNENCRETAQPVEKSSQITHDLSVGLSSEIRGMEPAQQIEELSDTLYANLKKIQGEAGSGEDGIVRDYRGRPEAFTKTGWTSDGSRVLYYNDLGSNDLALYFSTEPKEGGRRKRSRTGKSHPPDKVTYSLPTRELGVIAQAEWHRKDGKITPTGSDTPLTGRDFQRAQGALVDSLSLIVGVDLKKEPDQVVVQGKQKRSVGRVKADRATMLLALGLAGSALLSACGGGGDVNELTTRPTVEAKLDEGLAVASEVVGGVVGTVQTGVQVGAEHLGVSPPSIPEVKEAARDLAQEMAKSIGDIIIAFSEEDEHKELMKDGGLYNLALVMIDLENENRASFLETAWNNSRGWYGGSEERFYSCYQSAVDLELSSVDDTQALRDFELPVDTDRVQAFFKKHNIAIPAVEEW